MRARRFARGGGDGARQAGDVGLRLGLGDEGGVVVAGVEGAWCAAAEAAALMPGDQLRVIDGELLPAGGGAETLAAAERRLRGEAGAWWQSGEAVHGEASVGGRRSGEAGWGWRRS
jgi:hypothetical protein